MPLLKQEETLLEQAPPQNLIKFPRKKLIPGINDLATKHPEILELWDFDLNGALSPEGLTPGSAKKVWWRCGRGHRWEASPYSITTLNTRCPYCSGHKVIPGETDLSTRFPEVAALWDYENNGKADPSHVMPATKQKFWWRCEHGHTWEAAVYSLTIVGTGCPYCSGRFPIRGQTDLGTQCPEVTQLWDHEKNEGLEPSDVSPSSHKSVWWKCLNGHSWQARVYSVARDGRRCPKCAKSGPRPKDKLENEP